MYLPILSTKSPDPSPPPPPPPPPQSPPADERGMSTDEQRVRDLESSYDHVWGEQEEADKKRT